ncbi:MAG: FecR family protein [Prolixibacteraceae bacterium]|nr:FecR family protein [Prolixibacteraceae bacterium]
MDKDKLHNYTKYYLKGKLSKEHEQELLFWLKKSVANKKLFLEEQELLSRSFDIRNDKMVNSQWRILKQRLRAGNKQNKTKILFLKAASIAAAFIVGVLFTTAVITKYFLPGEQLAQIQNITTPYGAKTKIELPDGSSVWLNSGSTLSYPSKFNKTRPVTLTGEAFFEVEKNGKPFIVSTNYGEVEVKGTSFDVKAFERENFQTTLVTGSVLIREKDSKNEVTLRPGQQVNLLNKQLKIKNVETDLFTSWKDGKLIFRKEYLPTVIKRLARWYNVKIILANDKRLSNIWYSGTLEMESFSEVLELLKITAPIDYTYNEKTRTINITYKQK